MKYPCKRSTSVSALLLSALLGVALVLSPAIAATQPGAMSGKSCMTGGMKNKSCMMQGAKNKSCCMTGEMKGNMMKMSGMAGGMKNHMMKMMKDKTWVQHVQEALNDHGTRLRTDGICGKKTIDAIRAFQKTQGLKVTGMPDAETLKALGIRH